MKNIIIRSLSGAVYVALIVCSIIFADGLYFPVLCAFFAAVGVWEFQKMTVADFYKAPLTLLVDVIITMLLPLSFVISLTMFGSTAVFILISLLVMVRLIMALYSRDTDPVRRIAYSAASWLYIGMGLMFACYARWVVGPMGLLLMFIMVWLNDTGAFLVGSMIGRHRLFPRLSPKKSWEGFFGGVLFSVAAGVLAPILFPEQFFGFTPLCLGILGAVVSVMATWGDLFESMIKRHSGVKDSGNIIPGHGGILDRIDSLLFVAPAMVLYMYIYTIFTDFILIQGA